MNIIPNVVKTTSNGERAFDIYSCLLDDRIIMLDGQVDDNMSSIVRSQILYLAAKDNNKDIHIHINSPGGSVTAGLGIIDTMNFVKPNIVTTVVGMAASMGALIATCGEKGKRYITENSEIMIHQPLGGANGQATDILITAEHISKTRDRLNNILAKQTNQKIAKIVKDTERDNYMTATESIKYG
ncbi:MAG: ATP-dependent Clp protease proteolytic subunit, partial [Mycoplasmatales bacterium]